MSPTALPRKQEKELLKAWMGSSDKLVASQHGPQGLGTEAKETSLKMGRLSGLRLRNLCNWQCPSSGPPRIFLSITVICMIRLLLSATSPFLGIINVLQFITSKKLFVTMGF